MSLAGDLKPCFKVHHSTDNKSLIDMVSSVQIIKRIGFVTKMIILIF